MKKLTLSIAAVMAMSTFAIAGGDIAPVEEPMVEVVEPVVDDSSFYLGLAYGMGNFDWDQTYNYNSTAKPVNGVGYPSASHDFNTVMIQAGYNFNKYVAIEGRYWFGIDTSNSTPRYYEEVDLAVDAWGIYVKPQYPVTEAFKVYGLLGYAAVSSIEFSGNGWSNDLTDDFDVDGFSWGIGAAYAFTDNIEVFVDYVSIYDDTVMENDFMTQDYDIDTWNFGLTYKF